MENKICPLSGENCRIDCKWYISLVVNAFEQKQDCAIVVIAQIVYNKS